MTEGQTRGSLMSDTHQRRHRNEGFTLPKHLGGESMSIKQQAPIPRSYSHERPMSHEFVAASMSACFGSVVLLEVKKVRPNYLTPWQMSHQWGSCGTGFAIDNHRILTNAHVAQHATDIRLRKHGDSRRWRAKIQVLGVDVDLAVIVLHESVEEDDVAAFWKGVLPTRWAPELPKLQSAVNVVGYPTGGKTICVTEGVISRIDAAVYQLGAGKPPGKLLVIQIDAAINPGNSGGPCFDRSGKVVGVAFQGMSAVNVDNVGYIIPTCIVCNFLAALITRPQVSVKPNASIHSSHIACEQTKPIKSELITMDKTYTTPSASLTNVQGKDEHGAKDASIITGNDDMYDHCCVEDDVATTLQNQHVEYPGLQECPFQISKLQSIALRKYLQVPKLVSGVVVVKVAPLAIRAAKASGAPTFLRVNDVITHIDGRVIGNDWTVRLRGDELLCADFLITSKRKNEATVFDIRRGTKKLRIETILGPLVPNVPRYNCRDVNPNWVLIGGLLFVKVSCPLLNTNSKVLEAAGYLTIYDDLSHAVADFCEDEMHETVILINILANETNFGYTHYGWRILKKVNEQNVLNLAHVFMLYQNECSKVVQGRPSDRRNQIESNLCKGTDENTNESKNEEKPDLNAPTNDTGEFLVFEFKDESRIVLETQSCLSSEPEIMAQHGIPAAVSQCTAAAASKLRKELQSHKKKSGPIILR